MMDVYKFLEVKVIIWSLVFIRIIGLAVSMPVFSTQLVPVNVRVFISTFLSFLLSLNMNDNLSTDIPFLLYIYLLLSNFVIGATIGIIANIVFDAVQFAGSLFGLQMGFAISNVLDPTRGEEISLISQFSYILSIFAFIAIKGHILLFSLLVESFRKIPLVFQIGEKFVPEVASKLGDVIVLGVEFALPATAFMIFLYMVLGILSRMMPQLNVFIIGLPLNIMVGFLILLAVIGLWEELVVKNYLDLLTWIKGIEKLFLK